MCKQYGPVWISHGGAQPFLVTVRGPLSCLPALTQSSEEF